MSAGGRRDIFLYNFDSQTVCAMFEGFQSRQAKAPAAAPAAKASADASATGAPSDTKAIYAIRWMAAKQSVKDPKASVRAVAAAPASRPGRYDSSRQPTCLNINMPGPEGTTRVE
eukprot:NODE_16237_length_1005_cov_3.047836.p2 GENE.NODE_16237_length_1005_cov_3.047836~~NODE_16237_length_1005_cov_3.047836.p2  ORF type:complete len:115 (+),score=43.98 NODE_16237_length_1005_cov_3.047836:96-440(+)